MKIKPMYVSQKYGKRAALLIFLFLFSVMFVLLFSGSTSPRYPWYFGSDSAQFQTIGMAWAKGKIPYRDIFDHKGPMAFFFDMLGFRLTGSNAGICVFQILCLFIDLAAAAAIIGLYLQGAGAALIGTVIFAVMYAMEYGDGNFGEEYCLPFVLIAAYFQLKHLRSGEKWHDPRLALLYGIGFGVCLFSKVTNALTLCILTLVIAGGVLMAKEYRNFLRNCLMFAAGTLVIAVPFSIYFAAHGCFRAMLFSMIEFNITYQQIITPWVKEADASTWYEFFLNYFPYYCSALTLLLSLRKRDLGMAVYHVLVLLMGGWLFFGGAMAEQYMIMMLPNVLILTGEVFSLSVEGSGEDSTVIQTFLLIMLCAVCIQVMPDLIRYPSNMKDRYSEKAQTDYDVLLAGVPEEERDSFVAYGRADLKDIYLQNDIVPACKYFAIQSWHASLNPKTYQDILDVFGSAPCTWILVDSSADFISDALNSKYFLVGTNGDYALYHKNWE